MAHGVFLEARVYFTIDTLMMHRNRARSYRNRLLHEAFLKAKREGISTEYYDGRIVRPDDPTIYIHKDGEGNVDPTPLLNLVREDCAALYRKYERALSICERAQSTVKHLLPSLS